ncbi:hypothetical protein EGW08_014900 [Elysia chlorotica]|uniref:Uncharacterized protein n=1 Tax=Elysia chlorotica TaxID=188477 RepID=A0A433T701_ELYCH|nr:hypothetical protein EGW08_014900 [Elysia chlorotica]
MPSPLKFDFKEKKKTEKESKMGMGSSKLETVRQEDPSQYFLTELEDQIESSKNESFKPAAKQVPLMTPEEILACHYLRLNQDQVARLEKCIRDKGQDPGVHCHMDVTNYDVFSEIRRIRKAQKFGTTFEVGTYDEEDEDSLKEDKLRNDLSKQMPLNSDTLGTFKGKNPKTISSPKTKLPKI